MIYEMLDTGEKNARSARDLARALHTDRRSISAIIEQERRNGKPICATCDTNNPGYYIAETREEMQNYCDRLRHRAGEIFKTRAACLKTIDALPADLTEEQARN